jgi:hypothetical protein
MTDPLGGHEAFFFFVPPVAMAHGEMAKWHRKGTRNANGDHQPIQSWY